MAVAAPQGLTNSPLMRERGVSDGFKVELEDHRSAELDGGPIDPGCAPDAQLAITNLEFLARK